MTPTASVAGGAPRPEPRAPLGRPRAPLARPRDCVIGGVSVAVADHLGWPVAAVRWIFAGSSLLGGAGVLLYLWLWALTTLRPASADDPAEGVRRRVHVPWVLGVAGAVSGVVTVVLVASGAGGSGVGALAATILLIVAAVSWDQLVEDDSMMPAPLTATAFRLTAGAFLVGLALLLGVLQNGAGTGPLWLGIVAAAFAGAAVLVAPWALRLWRELIAERTARIKEEQRAEMAAHLHDSVLQTLALIQNRAGAASEVGRIARAQERELRDWLYADAAHSPERDEADLAAELHAAAAALEVDHAVHFDIVTVGEPVRGAPPELAAAAREAMLNAARHAGGEVSVYVESASGSADVFVRDRGPGFDVEALPEGRLGVRESIIGRMRRAGGRATVTRRPTGTEVHLGIEIQPSDDSGSETP
ncbi:ATP-binding protein [Leifsonia sp. F6_8S_P_1B]|uniref:ATP-binding protein n=1 Tax=Leifsonia williamsii TaxID=3035919 RepID=A0ABT8K9R8_9MICO|nr:ATP-binding protein [Leifsonia williamsii]MDN4614195.1 ATP-binding protein [Leifsonia williamsii]